MNKNEMKMTVQNALRFEYGFKPALHDIIINKLETFNDGKMLQIHFHVSHRKYIFTSHVLADGSIWTGEGTIERKNELLEHLFD